MSICKKIYFPTKILCDKCQIARRAWFRHVASHLHHINIANVKFLNIIKLKTSKMIDFTSFCCSNEKNCNSIKGTFVMHWT